MTERPKRAPPPLPVMLAGLALGPVPPVLLQPGASLAMAFAMRRHPGLFERLEELGDRTVLIDPVELPVRFMLRAGGGAPTLTVIGREDGVEADATIRGPLLGLIDLLEGRLDGDALFFSRALAIEGDTEAVVALRNAIDDAEIDLLEELLAPLGPFSGAARGLTERVRGLAVMGGRP